MNRAHTIGTKYIATKDLDVRDIAKLVRKDLKAAGIKASVRIERFSGGRAIDVTIQAAPSGTELADLVTWQPHVAIESDGWWRPAGLLDQVKAIVNAYNFDNSDSMTDYFHVRFYTHVEFSDELLDAARAAARQNAQLPPMAEIVAQRAAAAEPAQVELMRLLGAC